MKTLTCTHKELYQLLDGVRNLIEITDLPMGVIECYLNNSIRESFDLRASPTGRKDELIYYEVKYTDEFDKFLGGKYERLN